MMSGSVDVRRIRERTEEIATRAPFALETAKKMAAYPELWGPAMNDCPGVILTVEERDELLGELSRALDRAEKAETALRDVTAEEPEAFAKLIADAMERWDLDDCDDRVYEDDWELSTWVAFDVARVLRRAVLAGGDTQ